MIKRIVTLKKKAPFMIISYTSKFMKLLTRKSFERRHSRKNIINLSYKEDILSLNENKYRGN